MSEVNDIRKSLAIMVSLVEDLGLKVSSPLYPEYCKAASLLKDPNPGMTDEEYTQRLRRIVDKLVEAPEEPNYGIGTITIHIDSSVLSAARVTISRRDRACQR